MHHPEDTCERQLTWFSMPFINRWQFVNLIMSISSMLVETHVVECPGAEPVLVTCSSFVVGTVIKKPIISD